MFTINTVSCSSYSTALLCFLLLLTLAGGLGEGWGVQVHSEFINFSPCPLVMFDRRRLAWWTEQQSDHITTGWNHYPQETTPSLLPTLCEDNTHLTAPGAISQHGLDWVKFLTDICVPRKMSSSDFCDPLTFLYVASINQQNVPTTPAQYRCKILTTSIFRFLLFLL